MGIVPFPKRRQRISITHRETDKNGYVSFKRPRRKSLSVLWGVYIMVFLLLGMFYFLGRFLINYFR